MFFFSTNTICVQLISTIIRNQFDTIYNLLQRTKSTTIARHFFFLRTHICFLPPPASHFTSKAGLALRFKPRAKMCSNMSTKRRRKLIKGRMRLSTYLENGVSVCREHHNVCSLQRKIAQENEKNPPSVLKSYLRFDFLFSFEFLVIFYSFVICHHHISAAIFLFVFVFYLYFVLSKMLGSQVSQLSRLRLELLSSYYHS